MTAWRIASWDQAKARGSIVSEQHSSLDFDGAAALVNDFVAGEPVHVELRKSGDSFTVTKIWPDDPRVPDPSMPVTAPELDAATAVRLSSALRVLPISTDYRIARVDGDLVVQGDDASFEYGWNSELIFVGVEYLDLPIRWDGKLIRLANAKERRFLASRCEMRADLAAFKIVDESLRVYFIVCSDFRISPAPQAP